MKIPLDEVSVYPEFATAENKAILLVEGGPLAGYSLGFVPAGQSARMVYQGPLVYGPWAYAYARASVIDNHGGTGAELARAEQEGRLFRAKLDDEVELGGLLFTIVRDNNEQIKLPLATLATVSYAEVVALMTYVAENGRKWRSNLRDAWTRGETILREVRNKIGPSGLDNVLR